MRAKAEEAFNRLMNDSSVAHHDNLQKMLKAQSNVQKINECSDSSEDNDKKEVDEPELLGEAKSVIDDALGMLILQMILI